MTENTDQVEKTSDTKVAQDIFMRAVISLFWNDGKIEDAIRITLNQVEVEAFSKLRVVRPIGYRGATTRVWLSENFRPVSNAVFDKKSTEEVIEIWRHTKACKMTKVSRPPKAAKENALMKGARIGGEQWAHGWRAKHDWNTVK